MRSSFSTRVGFKDILGETKNLKKCLMIEPVWEVGKDTAIGPRGLRFDNRACQIGRSVANGSPPL